MEKILLTTLELAYRAGSSFSRIDSARRGAIVSETLARKLEEITGIPWEAWRYPAEHPNPYRIEPRERRR